MDRSARTVPPRSLAARAVNDLSALGRKRTFLTSRVESVHLAPARGAAAQSRGSTFTRRWSWLLPTQNVVGAVDLWTNTGPMLGSEGIRDCTVVPALGSRP